VPPTAKLATIGQRRERIEIQRATTVTDAMGGRSDTRFREFGTWWAKVTVVPFVVSDTQATMVYQLEGLYRRDVVDLFNGGLGLRAVVRKLNLTMKVLTIEMPRLANRTMVLHCGKETNA
jgi:hypothetical protein